MIQLLFTVLAAEVVVVLLLLIKNPFRKLVTVGLDNLKRGSGPIMVKTIAGTLLIVFLSSLYSMKKIQMRSSEVGTLTPTDQVLWSRHLLEASLMGYSLFLSLIIDRMHHYIRELRALRKNKEALIKQNKALEEGKGGSLDEMKSRDSKIAALKERMEELESVHASKMKEAEVAEANITTLKKQSEGFVVEYESLLDDNRNLQEQLQSIDLSLSHSNGKKNT